MWKDVRARAPCAAVTALWELALHNGRPINEADYSCIQWKFHLETLL